MAVQNYRQILGLYKYTSIFGDGRISTHAEGKYCRQTPVPSTDAPDPTGELTTLPQTPNRLGRGIPSPRSPLSTSSASRSRRIWRRNQLLRLCFFSNSTPGHIV